MRPRVVVIDDSVELLALFVDLLAEEGFDAITCADGELAHGLVLMARPDAVVLDLHLGKHTGLDLLTQFRADPRLATTPIIVCSAEIRLLQEQAGFLEARGCVTLLKPFDVDTLLSLLQRVCGAPSALGPELVASRCGDMAASASRPRTPRNRPP